MASGRKTLTEELSVLRRFEQLSPKVFGFVEEMLDSKKKSDKVWASDWLKNGYAKLLPQIIQGDKDNPLFFMPSDLMTKNEIATDKNSIPSKSASSGEEQAQVSDSQLRPEVGQDNAGSVGNDSQSGEQAKPEGSVPGPDLPAGTGDSVDSFIESLPTAASESK